MDTTASSRSGNCAKGMAFTPSSRRWTPAPQNSTAIRPISIPPTRKKMRRRRPRTQSHHSGQRPQPHRAGHRVRLLLLPCCVRAQRRRLRNHHGQLQSGDGLDRLRHQRPPLLRAAHPRRRAGRLRARGLLGRRDRDDRAVRRPDSAESRPAAEGCRHTDPGHLSRIHRPGRGSQALRQVAGGSGNSASRRAPW